MIFGRKMLLWGILFIIFASSAMSAGHEELLIADSIMRPNQRHGVETIQVLLFGKVNFYDALQIRRLLRPWVEPVSHLANENVASFYFFTTKPLYTTTFGV